MTRPPNLAQAKDRGLYATSDADAIHTFSNGSEWDSWASENCHRCRWYDPETAGVLCAFEAAAFMHRCTGELAALFGWIQDVDALAKYGPRSGWDAPESCRFFSDSKDDDSDDDAPPPPPPDPAQLVLLADPTEDAAIMTGVEVPDLVEVP